ncbi:down syndrome critical region protein 3 [Histomonas meleagridis]|uniref:down syndrome critical region protein 3 n=1 Tax=Histomonas meleagridis TaxID=135588 RepID=UPI003559EF52|nr:down syndrome critical region protein 3 [Histomonas meleagridis]KAH0801010.1 down syndrome critical region protein 3 [Histomonas meleagridis]
MPSVVSFKFDRLALTYLPDEPINCTGTFRTNEVIKPKEILFNVYCVRTVDINKHNYSFDTQIQHNNDNTILTIPIKHDFPKAIENGYNFSFQFTIPKGKGLTESIRGEYISVDYFVEIVIKRGVFSQDLIVQKPFFIVYKTENIPKGEPVDIVMNETNIRHNTPKVKFTAKIHLPTPVASSTHPPRGSIVFVESESPVTSCTVSYARDEIISLDRSNPQTFSNEVCRMQIIECDPPYGVEIPFVLEWVRVFVLPDIETNTFSMKTGLKVRVHFENGGYASLVIPLKLCRTHTF